MDKTNNNEHEKQMNVVVLCGLLISCAAFFCGCSSSLKLSSAWRQGEIVIDGSGAEWQRGLFYDKESDIVYSIRNDSDYIYFFLKTQNRTTEMQIMKTGFTVWFDAQGGNEHSFGIRYPLARQGVPSEFHPESDDEQNRSTLEQGLELEIVGAQKEDIQRFSTLDVPGIRVKIGRSQDVLVYELQVPLRKTPLTPFALGVSSANRIGIGLETEEFNRDQMKMGTRPMEGLNERNPGDSPIEGGEHEGLGYNEGGHRSGVRENNEKRKQLKLWLSVQLARTQDVEPKRKN